MVSELTVTYAVTHPPHSLEKAAGPTLRGRSVMGGEGVHLNRGGPGGQENPAMLSLNLHPTVLNVSSFSVFNYLLPSFLNPLFH